MNGKSFLSILLLFVSLGPIFTTNLAVNARSSQYSSPYPEFLSNNLPFMNTFYSFSPEHSNQTITRYFNMSEFRDVTFARVFIQHSASFVQSISVSCSVNGHKATNVQTESTFFDQETWIFVLDAKAMIIPSPSFNNSLSFFINVTFQQKNVWDLKYNPSYTIRFNSITVETAYRQQAPYSANLNQTNSQFTALIVDPSYQVTTPGFLFNSSNSVSFFDYTIVFYLILPKGIQSNYFVNISVSYNYQLDVRSLFIDQFGLQTSNPSDSNITNTFRFISNQDSYSIVQGFFKFNPKSQGTYHINVDGQFFITNSFKIFPGGPEMDFFLFINATLIIPLVFLSRLIYRRLNY